MARFIFSNRSPLARLTWRQVMALSVVAALAVAALVVFSLMFLVLVPIAAVAGLFARYMVGRKMPPKTAKHGPEVIEGRYEVIDPD